MSEQTPVEQVGGRHYGAKQHGNQHWDLMEAWDIDYLTATGTKYVARWRDKGTPIADLEKSVSYFEKVLSNNRGALRTIPYDALRQFYEVNNTKLVEHQIMTKVLHLGSPADYRDAIGLVRGLIDRWRSFYERRPEA